MKQIPSLLGILGGLGPMSTFYFCELLTAHTAATTDADHIDMIISSHASTPDRTAFILGKSHNDPLPVMVKEAKRLEHAGADLIVIPCNTAHYFYDGLRANIHTPMLNIIEETVKLLKQMNIHTFGLLATDGTVRAGAYKQICEPYGLECLVPSSEEQGVVSSIIYNCIKQNRPVDMQAFDDVVRSLRARGCEKLVLGCTELSLLKKNGLDEELFVDSLEVLAYRTIVTCGKTPTGFPPEFTHLKHEDKP